MGCWWGPAEHLVLLWTENNPKIRISANEPVSRCQRTWRGCCCTLCRDDQWKGDDEHKKKLQRWMESSAVQETSPETQPRNWGSPATWREDVQHFSPPFFSSPSQHHKTLLLCAGHCTKHCHFMGGEIFIHLSCPSAPWSSQLQSYSLNERTSEETWGEEEMPHILIPPPTYGETFF